MRKRLLPFLQGLIFTGGGSQGVLCSLHLHDPLRDTLLLEDRGGEPHDPIAEMNRHDVYDTSSKITASHVLVGLLQHGCVDGTWGTATALHLAQHCQAHHGDLLRGEEDHRGGLDNVVRDGVLWTT